MKRGYLILFAVAVLLALAVWRTGPKNMLPFLWISFSEDTAYAPGYSERAFKGIVIGDREAAVVAALGAPLSESTTAPYTEWLYTGDPTPTFAESGRWPGGEVSYTLLRFSENGVLTEVTGQLSGAKQTGLGGVLFTTRIGDGANTLGLKQAAIDELKAERAGPKAIEARFGKPREMFTSRVVRWLRYSRSPGSKDYRLRMIGLDADGKVCQVRREIYWD